MDSTPSIDATELPDRSQEEQILVGTRISPGLAMGTAWVAGDILECSAQALRINSEQIEAEMEQIRARFF